MPVMIPIAFPDYLIITACVDDLVGIFPRLCTDEKNTVKSHLMIMLIYSLINTQQTNSTPFSHLSQQNQFEIDPQGHSLPITDVNEIIKRPNSV